MVILGGAFLITPGFITDVIGTAAADPADPRDVPRDRRPRSPCGAPRSRCAPSAGGRGARGAIAAAAPPTPARGYDYEGSAREVPDPERELPRPRTDGGSEPGLIAVELGAASGRCAWAGLRRPRPTIANGAATPDRHGELDAELDWARLEAMRLVSALVRGRAARSASRRSGPGRPRATTRTSL